MTKSTFSTIRLGNGNVDLTTFFFSFLVEHVTIPSTNSNFISDI